jgi:hypothetical protein
MSFMIMRNLVAVEKRKWGHTWLCMYVEFYWYHCCLWKCLQHCFICTPLASMMNITVWAWDWCRFIWNMMFQLNRCHRFLWKEEWLSHRYSSNILIIIFGGLNAKHFLTYKFFILSLQQWWMKVSSYFKNWSVHLTGFSILIEHIYHTLPLYPSNMLKMQLAQF